MAKKIRIAFYFELHDKAQYAAFQYLKTMIASLGLMKLKSNVELVIIYSGLIKREDFSDLNFPSLEFYNAVDVYGNIFKRAANKFFRVLFKNNLFPFVDKNFPTDIDAIFPCPLRDEIKPIRRKIFWKPDFQEKYYPEYFSYSETADFDKGFKRITDESKHILVLSSENAKHDLEFFFNEFKCELKVIPFIVFIPDELLDIPITTEEMILSEFRIKPYSYYIISNQFWPHKNHKLVLESIELLDSDMNDVKFVFTGQTSTNRSVKIFEEIQKMVAELNIQDRVLFTGFIDKKTQLILLKNSIGVIQPSLFEGWNTTIEEAKALNKFVICSDIEVHKEQISENVLFFEKHSAEDLKDKLLFHHLNKIQIKKIDYNINIAEYQKMIMELFCLDQI